MTLGLGPGSAQRPHGVLFVWECELAAHAGPLRGAGRTGLVSATVPAGPAQAQPIRLPSARWVLAGFKAQGHWRNDQFSILFPNYSAD